MKEYDNTLKYSEFWKQREDVYKAEKMKPIEKKIDNFLAENAIKYHRCFPVRVGGRNNKDKSFGLCSFYLPQQNIILDVPTGAETERTYDVTLPVFIQYHSTKVNAIFPIDEDCPWREIKKQLKILLNI